MELLSVMSGGDVRNMVKSARLLDYSEELWCIMINNFCYISVGWGGYFYKNILNMCESCHYQVPSYLEVKKLKRNKNDFCMDILGNSINKIYDMWFLNGTFKCDEWW